MNFTKIVFLILTICLLLSQPGFTQMQEAEQITQHQYQRTLNALQTHVQDEMSYFEGFLLCKQYPEKRKLLDEIKQTVETVEVLAQGVTFNDGTLNKWRSKAHFFYGIALGLLGDKINAESQITQAKDLVKSGIPTLSEKDFSTWFDMANDSIKIGDKMTRLASLEQTYLQQIDALAYVEVHINEKRRHEINEHVLIREAKITNKEDLLHILAYAGEKLSQDIARGESRSLIFLPKGKYQIVKGMDLKPLIGFKIKSPTDVKKITLPPRETLYYYLVAGLVGAISGILIITT